MNTSRTKEDSDREQDISSTSQPYPSTGPLPVDLYAHRELSTDSERKKNDRIGDSFRTDLAPVVNGYWARAEFHSSR